MNEWLRARFENARRVWQKLSATQKASLVGAASAIIIAVVLLISVSTKASYQPLFTNLSPKDAGAIQLKLKDAKVSYRVTQGGSTIEVPADQVYELRNTLSSEGLPSGSNVIGYELFDKYSGLGGGNEFTQKIDRQRALEGELSRTISQVAGVEKGIIHLVLPEPELFTEKEKPTSASVFLKLRPGERLGVSSVKGIMHLVASSVEGLSAKNVTVVDTEGNILSNIPENVAQMGIATNQLGLQRKIENGYKEKIQSMLDTALGPGKSVIQVSADLDWTSREIKRELYGKPVPQANEQTIESYQGTQPLQGGVPGTATNIPTYQAPGTAGGGGTSNYRKNDTKTRNLVPKTSEKTSVPAGAIKRLNISVLYDSGRRGVLPQVAASIQQTVQTAAGIDPKRGDRVTVASMPFDHTLSQVAQGEMEKASRDAMVSNAVKYGLTGLGLLLMLLFVRRGLRPLYRPIPALAPELALEKVQAPVPISELEVGEEEPELPAKPRRQLRPELALEGARRSEMQDKVEAMIGEKPEDVARLIRSWIVEKQKR